MHFYSPSQIEGFRGCARKWVFKSLLRVETPQGKAAALGDEVHKQLENYLDGKPLDYSRESGYIAAAALIMLPRPEEVASRGELLTQERKIGFEFQNVLFTGRVDWTWKTATDVTVGDHKTTSNIHYAKTPKMLQTDPQALIYAYDAMNRFETPKVNLRWGYVQTRKPYTPKPVDATMESPHVVEQLRNVVQSDIIPMDRLLRFKEKKSVALGDERVTRVVSEVPPTPDHCEAFGGCPYKAMCPDVSAGERLKSLMSNSNGSFFDKLAKRAVDNPVDPVNPPPPAAVAPDNQKILEELAPKVEPPEEKKERKPRATKEKAATESSSNKVRVFIDCSPVGSSAEMNTLSMIADAKKIVNEQCEVDDYRFKGFGEGAGALAVAVVTLAKSGNYGKDFVLDSRTPEGALLSVPLREIAGEIYTGSR